MMSLGECWYEGALRPYAYLYSLSVHPDYRRRGIGARIATWRVERARTELGRDVVIYAGVQQGNEGSLSTARRWATQRLDNRTGGAVQRMPGARQVRHDEGAQGESRGRVGLSVRQAEEGDWEEIGEKQNAFYAGWNLYRPGSAEGLRDWQAEAPFGFPLHAYYVANDAQGNLLAGVALTEEGRLLSSEVGRVTLPLRLANVFLRILPPDRMIRRVAAKSLWYAPGRLEAARRLWQAVPWLWRERGSTLMMFYDPQSTLAQVAPPPRLMPALGGSLVLTGPAPMSEERCIYYGN